MQEDLMQEALRATRDCAIVALENAAFILKELNNVQMPEALRAQTEDVCGHLINTKCDIFSELFEFGAKATEGTKAAEVRLRLNQIVECLHENGGKLTTLVNKLDRACEDNQSLVGAYLLVSESATNVLRAFDRTRKTVERLILSSNAGLTAGRSSLT